MKTKNVAFISGCLIFISIFLTGCYRKKILVDADRAKQQLILIEQAKDYEKRFIAAHEELAKAVPDTSFLKNRFSLPNAESFNRDMIGLLLNQEGADGIRIYYGEDEKGQIRLILLPVDKNGTDLTVSGVSAISIPGISEARADNSYAGESGQACPPCTIK